MKLHQKISIIVLLMISINGLFSPDALAQKGNVLKINIFSPIAKTLNLQYERKLSSSSSFQLGFYYSGFSITDTKFSGFGLTPEYRFYLSDTEAPHGVYVAPFVRYQNFSVTNGSDKGTLTTMGGGLIIGKDKQENSGIPILSDIPFLGKLFGSTTNSKDRSELMVFIQPSVVQNDRSLNAVQADMDSRYKVSPKAHEMADGPGVLPPVGAISPVTDKEGASHPAATQQAPAASTVKPSVRPSFRQ